MPEIKKQSKKTTAQKVKERIDHALKMLNQNMSMQDIRTSSIKKFNVTEKQVDVYIAEAKKLVVNKKNDIVDTRLNKKATDMESRKRVIKIMEMLLDCEPRYKIIQYCTKTYKINDRQSDKYISKAKKRIVQRVRKQEKTSYEDAIARRERIYNKSIKRKSYKTALQIDDSRAKLQGLFTENIKIAGDKDNPVELVISKLSDEQLKKIKETQKVVKDAGNNA